MTEINRRRFLGGAAAMVPLGMMVRPRPATAATAGVRADTIVTGGNLITMDPNQPSAEAMAIRGEHILAVGSNDDIRNLADSKTRMIDASGYTVTPGFIDSHSHPLLAEATGSVNVDYRRIEQVKAALRAHAATLPPGHGARAKLRLWDPRGSAKAAKEEK